MDIYEKLVGEAVTAIRSNQEQAVLNAMNALSSLTIQDLIAELCLWVEDLIDDKDVNNLLSVTRLPLPDKPEQIIEAVKNNDIQALHAYCNGDIVDLLASMLMLIASLQETAEII